MLEEALMLLANLAILGIVIVLGFFITWWTWAMNPRKMKGSRSVLLFASALELVGLLAVVLNWLPTFGVTVPGLLEQALRASVWWLVLAAVVNMAVTLFTAWWRNDSPEEILTRYWTRVRERPEE